MASPEDLVERIERRPRTEYVRSLGVAAALFILTNLSVGYVLKKESPNLGFRIISEKQELAIATEANILFLGDSSANQSVIPEDISMALGFSTLNLATIADATVLGDVLILERYLSKFPPPKCVVIIHTHDMWSRSLAASVLAVHGLSSWRKSMRWKPLLENPVFAAKTFLALLLPTLVQDRSIRDLLSEKRGHTNQIVDSITAHGYMKRLESDVQRVESDVASHIERLDASELEISPDNQLGLAKLAKLAEEYSIEFFYAPGPIHWVIAADLNYREAQRRINNAVRSEFEENAAHITILDFDNDFETSEMENADHVVHSSAEKYSIALMNEIYEHKDSCR